MLLAKKENGKNNVVKMFYLEGPCSSSAINVQASMTIDDIGARGSGRSTRIDM